MAKKESPVATKSPRTVQELGPWLNMQFARLLDSIERSERPANTAEKDATAPLALAPASHEEAVQQLIASLHQVLAHTETLLVDFSRPALATEATLEDLTRALLLSGNGEMFEPAIRAAIRDYCDTVQEIRRHTARRGMPDAVREDIVAGFTRVLSRSQQELRLLGVQALAVPRGTALDPGRHRVVKKLSTTDSELLHTVRQCVTPVFTWKNPYGLQRVEPARVVAYTLLEESPGERTPPGTAPDNGKSPRRCTSASAPPSTDNQ